MRDRDILPTGSTYSIFILPQLLKCSFLHGSVTSRATTMATKRSPRRCSQLSSPLTHNSTHTHLADSFAFQLLASILLVTLSHPHSQSWLLILHKSSTLRIRRYLSFYSTIEPPPPVTNSRFCFDRTISVSDTTTLLPLCQGYEQKLTAWSNAVAVSSMFAHCYPRCSNISAMSLFLKSRRYSRLTGRTRLTRHRRGRSPIAMSEKPSASAYANHVQRMGAYSYNGSSKSCGTIFFIGLIKIQCKSPVP